MKICFKFYIGNLYEGVKFKLAKNLQHLFQLLIMRNVEILLEQNLVMNGNQLVNSMITGVFWIILINIFIFRLTRSSFLIIRHPYFCNQIFNV